MRLVWAIALAWLVPAVAIAQTPTWSGPFSQTYPTQNGTMACMAPTTKTLTCALSASLLPPYPVVTPASYAVPTPVSADELIGTIIAINGPITELNIVSGDIGNPTLDPPGYFNVYAATMHIRTSEAMGAKLPPAGSYNLMITASNAAGTSAPVAITVVVP